MPKRAKHEYVVGFKGDHEVIYGREDEGEAKWVDKCTLAQAKRIAGKLDSSQGMARTIYKLVPVEVIPNA